MTSYDPPDHDIRITLTPEEFQSLSGIAFSVTVTVDGMSKINDGMLIIPQGDDGMNKSGEYDAWLWLGDKTELSPMTRVSVKILSTCDPMLIQEESKDLRKFSGTTLEAHIMNLRQGPESDVPG
jgi:hypothetical protein